MIRFARPVNPADGQPVDILCPVVVCDVCGEFLSSERPGLLMYALGDLTDYHIHVECSDDAELRQRLPFSRSMQDWINQLLLNYRQPLQTAGAVSFGIDGYTVMVTDFSLDERDAQ